MTAAKCGTNCVGVTHEAVLTICEKKIKGSAAL